ncbi:MAG: phosphate signaling complex protein PhoU [Chloroflexi bacterium]|nr:phosphate signaling complex protein PhoU [Chloroflexota bacterium]
MRDDILRLSSKVDNAIEQAMNALNQRDVQLAHAVISADEEINKLRFEIEEDALRCLATQQPMAIDLRTTIAAIHIAVELERMGDHASGIARLVERLENDPPIDTLHKLPKMAKRARQMIQAGVQAYIESNEDLAIAMVKRDDKIDKHYRSLFRSSLEEMRDDDHIRRSTFLLWVGHNLERIGDRATNIAERVVFMKTGQLIEIEDQLD